MFETLFQRSKLMFENIARFSSKRVYLDQLFNDTFFSVLKHIRWPFAPRNRVTSWCEVKHNFGGCRIPNYRYCNDSCMNGYGLTTKCPTGYQTSYAWGYRTTGCWCDTSRGKNIICCDCTPVSNSPYYQSAADCGCMHFLEE